VIYRYYSFLFLKKVGHLLGLEAGYEPAMDGCGTVDHEGIGGDFIRGLGLHDNIAYLTEQHVSAKRYIISRIKIHYVILYDSENIDFYNYLKKFSSISISISLC